MDVGGAYTADRAAALSGVPKSTVHYWARTAVLVPEVSPERVKLWSYRDLLALRTIDWLRQPKRQGDLQIPPSRMRTIRHALRRIRALELDLFDHDRPVVAVTRAGEVVITEPGRPPETHDGQLLEEEFVDLIAPFQGEEGARGPDLLRPSDFVRIVPRRLSGAPHVVDTRIPTESLYALFVRGFSLDRIGLLYPDLPQAAVIDAVGLEKSLNPEARHAA